MKKPMYYLAQPYSHPDKHVMEARYRFGCAAAAACHRAGLLYIAPIPSSHNVAAYNTGTEWKHWQELDLRYVDVCDAVLLLDIPGWEHSVGVAAELNHARATSKEIIYFSQLHRKGKDFSRLFPEFVESEPESTSLYKEALKLMLLSRTVFLQSWGSATVSNCELFLKSEWSV